MVTVRKLRSTALVLAAVLVAAAGCGGGGDGGSTETKSDEPVTIRYSWWGNPARAELMQKSLDLFKTKYPHITVTPSFQEFADYWTKIATEAAGNNLPDVLQMDNTYLREYGDRGALLDLKTQEKNLDVKKLLPAFEGVGELKGKRVAVPIGGNTWSTYYTPALMQQAGVAEPANGWTWSEYFTAAEKVHKATGVYGVGDASGIFFDFESVLRQKGKLLYTEDGKFGFTKQDLTDYWNAWAQRRAAGYVLPVAKGAEVEPKTAMESNLIAAETGWDNFFVRYSGVTKHPLKLGPVPTDNPSNTGQYVKPSMLMSASAKTKHPAEAAKLIDFLINDPEVGKIMAGNRGIPASKAQREAAQFTGANAEVVAYEEAMASKMSKAPPPPPKGAGTLEAAFKRIAQDVQYNKTKVPAAVDQFFKESQDVLGT